MSRTDLLEWTSAAAALIAAALIYYAWRTPAVGRCVASSRRSA